MAKPAIKGSPDEILQHMLQSKHREHNMLVYPSLDTLRLIYSRYSKSHLETGKGLVVHLPTYENIPSVRRVLANTGLDVDRLENDKSLVILDSVKGYHQSNPNILSVFEMLAKRAQSKEGGGGGCSVISDMGSFSFLNKEKELLDYERSLPLRFSSMNCKGFCCYHQANFDRLSEDQKEKLFEHHYKNLIITKCN
jgi:MEDS: MEthanogen/methylotroph, DcmR Sensory domain